MQFTSGGVFFFEIELKVEASKARVTATPETQAPTVVALEMMSKPQPEVNQTKPSLCSGSQASAGTWGSCLPGPWSLVPNRLFRQETKRSPGSHQTHLRPLIAPLLTLLVSVAQTPSSLVRATVSPRPIA